MGAQLFGNEYETHMVEKIHCALFGFESPSIPTLKANIDEIHDKNSVKVEEQFDVIAVLDKGLVVNRKDPKDPREVITDKGKALGVIGIIDNDGKTLQRFLWYLSSLPDTMISGRPIIMDYFKFLLEKGVKVVADKYELNIDK